jgi:sugar lactone lactonase YvrE
VAYEAGDVLGEGPCWRADAGELLWTDIERGLLHAWRPGEPAARTWQYLGDVSAALPRANGGLLLAISRTLMLVEPDGPERTIAAVEPDKADNRFNDCRCDPQGRLWAGTMSKHEEPGQGALYRLVPGGEVECVLPEVTLSNGIGWSPDGTRMYYIDTPTRQVDVFDFDGETGMISGRRPFARLGPGDGFPDGLAVDAEGGVWVAMYAGAAVRRFDTEGALSEVLTLPVANPTCPAFGGDDLATLFITTAKHQMSEEERARSPLSGALFAAEPGVRGLPPTPFAG